MPPAEQPPGSEPALRIFAMPKDSNANGDVFGGWVMANMDLAGAVPAVVRAGGRIATVAVNGMRIVVHGYVVLVSSKSKEPSQNRSRVNLPVGRIVNPSQTTAQNRRITNPSYTGTDHPRSPSSTTISSYCSPR